MPKKVSPKNDLLIKRSVYLGDTLWHELSQEAKKEGRSTSNLLLVIASDWLEAKRKNRGH